MYFENSYTLAHFCLATCLKGRGAVHPEGCRGPLSSSLSLEPAGYPSPEEISPKDQRRESLLLLHSFKWLKMTMSNIYDGICSKQQLTTNSSTHIIVCPQLQAAGADAEDAGEKLIWFKELWNMKILCQVGELFAQISRFLWKKKHLCLCFFFTLISPEVRRTFIKKCNL